MEKGQRTKDKGKLKLFDPRRSFSFCELCQLIAKILIGFEQLIDRKPIWHCILVMI